MYRVRLEDILNDIIIISEIAELSVEADSIVNELGLQRENEENITPPSNIGVDVTMKNGVSAVRWPDVKLKENEIISQYGSEIEVPALNAERLNTEEEGFSELMNVELTDEGTAKGRNGFYESSSNQPTMDLLDKWEEPVNKRDKVRTQNGQSQLSVANFGFLTECFRIPGIRCNCKRHFEI
jgi:hypothetical protein